MTQSDNWRELNIANWNDRVPVHLASEFYDLEGFRSGRDSLPDYEVAEVGDVAGKSLLHLQCHIGLDTLSWARRGATVTGLDFSAPAIDAARDLAANMDLAAEFVTSDVYEASSTLTGRSFDIVYTGIGALCWLPDIPRWARVVASLIAPGGFLYLTDGHPFALILDFETGTTVETDYFDTTGVVEDFPHTYTDGDALEHTTSVQFQHPLGEIVTALIAAGLRIEFLHEQDFSLWRTFRTLRPTGGYFRPEPGKPRVPLLFSLRAAQSS